MGSEPIKRYVPLYAVMGSEPINRYVPLYAVCPPLCRVEQTFADPVLSGSSVLDEREPVPVTLGLFRASQAGHGWPTVTSLSSQSLPPGVGLPGGNLSPEVAELRAEVHRLQAENNEFRQQAGYRKRRHRDNLKRINALERKVEPTPMVFRALMAARTLLFSTSRGPSFSGH